MIQSAHSSQALLATSDNISRRAVRGTPQATGPCRALAIRAPPGGRERRDGQTGQPRGFGFVEMATDADAQKAITMFHEHDLGGRNLAVNEARPKAAGFAGGGGGNRGREPRW